ncbi:hypothetical protein [Bifidobacterium angulatum]|uniref:hypothetical protein n=1 Tax=Bifidobacterium angulatum TaxID=1683 RepID=UPI002E79C094|nr:hypothetical protein [Bifidobacterium angulatum]
MQPNTKQPGMPTAERVAQVRSLRRAAIKRRRIIVAALALITVVVLVCAFSLRFSPLYALIPGALLAVVLAFGVHASKQAHEWEHELSLARKRVAGNKAVLEAQKKAREEREVQCVREQAQAQAVAETPTDEMTQREIRQALHKAQVEQRKALQEHAARKSQEQQGKAVVAVAERPLPEPHSESETVREAGAQDLISFSLGRARDVDVEAAESTEHAQEDPRSLEIKSTRQVAKAEPVDTAEREALASQAKMETEPASAQDHDKAFDAQTVDVDSFHKSEQSAQVAVPAATCDSLGGNLEEILARRVAQ